MKRHALIVGGTNGIGLAIATAFCYENIKVSVVGRDNSNILKLQTKFDDLSFIKYDFLSDSDLNELVELITKLNSPIDILVNCAGYLPPLKLFKDYSYEEFKKTIHINLNVPVFITRFVLSEMLKMQFGVIINISSLAAIKPAPKWMAYNISKAGLDMFSRTLAQELIESNIKIYSVNPGATRTSMRHSAFPNENPLKLPHPIEMVGLYIYLIRELPPSSGDIIDLYDWLKNNQNWAEYGKSFNQLTVGMF